MSNRIITIEREYASGGREVGQKVAEALGIPFYNREILEMASERCGVSVDYLASAEEAAPKSFLYTLMLSSNPTRSIEDNLPLSDKVYIVETNIIRELAEKEDCVIVGRCASYILRSHKPFRIFVHASLDSRLRRCMEHLEEGDHLTEREMRRHIKAMDKGRAKYFRFYTEMKWGDKANYDLCINTTDVVIKDIVPVIAKLFKN
jgi:cytidylate kinase